jgi:hypothetical protein
VLAQFSVFGQRSWLGGAREAEVAEDGIVHDITIAWFAEKVKGGNRPVRYG